MSINIKYKNSSGFFIPEIQANSLKSFEKITYVDEQIKYREYTHSLRGGEFRTSIYYFVSENEQIENVLLSYIDKYEIVGLYTNKQTTLNFTMWDFTIYSSEGLVDGRSKIVFDRYDRIIFSAPVNLVSGQISDTSAKTYYNPSSIEEEIYYMFRYNILGEIEWVTDLKNDDVWAGGYYPDEFMQIGIDPNIDFIWEQHPYYHSAYPFLPTGEL